MSTTTVIALFGVIVAIAAFTISAWLALMARRDLTLTAYANAIQGGILDLKRTFAEHPDIFYEQMEMNPAIRQLIPEYMQGEENIPKFLAFAGGMWRLSYVYSVMIRGGRLGLKKSERDGLRGEMKLWLTGVPGFYHVYKSQVAKLQAHNPKFKDFLDEVYSSKDFRKALAERSGYDPEAQRETPDAPTPRAISQPTVGAIRSAIERGSMLLKTCWSWTLAQKTDLSSSIRPGQHGATRLR